MESIGEKLRSARELRRLSIKDVSKDTIINPIYLVALEEEDFDKFPGETYLIGFLRSYSEYLKLDTDEIIQAYKGYKIGESVTPLEELTKPTRSSLPMLFSNFTGKYKNVLFTAVVMAAVLVVIWGVKTIFSSDVDIEGGDSIENIRDEYNAKNMGTKIENITNLQLHNDRSIILISRNEAVQFLVDNKEIVFLLRSIEKNGISVEFLPSKKVERIEMEKTRIITLEDCPREVILTLKGMTENKAKVKIMLGKKFEIEPVISIEDKTPVQKGDNTRVIAQDNKNLKIVFEAEFTQKSFVELYLDGVKRTRGFIARGTRERWEATEYIQIKIGNAGGLNAKINGKKYIFGKSGQIANKVITWKKDLKNPNLYNIVIKDW